jgi:hypothetical protein
MALIKNHKKTEENRSARRRNGRQSQGATTEEGKERSRAANLKHGYYSQLRDEALIALGEDPSALKALIAGAYEQFEPANPMQAAMAEHLAHLHWRMLRAERLQESSMVLQIQRVEDRHRQQAQQYRYAYSDLHEFLGMTCAAVGRPDFCALPCVIGACTAAMKHSTISSMKEILHLLYRLRRPQRFTDPPPPPLPESLDDESWALGPELFAKVEKPCPPHAEISVAEGEERDELRQELRDLIETQISANKATWEKTINELEAPLPLLERDQMAAAAMKENALMRRDESSCSREFWRTANMLMKFQAQDKSEVKQESEVRSPESEVENPEELIIFASQGPDAGATVEFPSSEQAVPTSDFGPRTSDSDHLTPDAGHLTPSSRNAGASGDIHENKGNREMKSEIARRVREGQAQPGTGETPAGGQEFDLGVPAALEEASESLPDAA